MAVADIVTAMSEYRPYQECLSKDHIISFLEQERGKKFELDIAQIGIELISSGWLK